MSKVNATVHIDGIPETLRALRQIDPDLRRQVPDEIKSYAQPMLAELKAALPSSPPLTGWSKKGRLGYRASSARFKTTLQFRGSRPRNSPPGSFAVLRVRSKHLAAMVYDMAGRRSSGQTSSGRAMIAALNSRHGAPSRGVWPIVEKHAPEIEDGIEETFKRYAKIVSRGLAR